MALFGKRKEKEIINDDVIVDEVRVSVYDLKKKASQANQRFWALICALVLISSMILPYMSNAAVAGQESDAFTGTVVPGYSMGGLEIAAYGIDINQWGKITSDKAIRSNYGVWSETRGINAIENLNQAEGSEGDSGALFVRLSGDKSANYNLTTTDKSRGWQAITGHTGYTGSHPDGLPPNSQSDQVDEVSPYRTVNDFNYWTSQTPKSGNNASADITVSLFPDFIVVAIDSDGNVVVPESADDYRAQAKSETLFDGDVTKTSNNAAIPHYVSLKAIFDAYGITDPSEANINILMQKIRNEPALLKNAVESENLLEGTSYTSLNSDEKKETEDSFNPYPYSMVFSTETENGRVVSSIYENSEAYVYFSPASVYSSYMKLKEEFEHLRSAGATPLDNYDQVTTFQLGYYLAGMSILEAYLNEALPQDMTRGYVGPSETPAIATASSKGDGLASGKSKVSPGDETTKSHAYSLLMYDYARDYIESLDDGGAKYKLGLTNAIMDTLSVYGYSSPYGNPGPGVMKGLTAAEARTRPTLLTDAVNDAKETKESHDTGDSGDIGIYTPVYYPVQQHKMPDAEKPYRFQILASVPYETVITYIKNLGLGGQVQFTYSSSEVNNRTNTANIRTVEQYKEAVAGLADMYEKAEEGSTGLTVASADTGNMLALNAAGDSGNGAEYSEDSDERDETTKRSDNALLGYYASNMTADNVHDLFDVVRSTKGLKYETWYRYYNPVKSEGGDMDLFVTRVSPALNVYMPSVLINGYTCSGSGYINDTLTTTNCSFDYYSTPSFAPCFATHTTDACYYGILNYEQRVFYSRAFLDSLPRNSIGIPAVELVELADEAMKELTNGEKLDQKTANNNLAVLYIMTKRLAALQTINTLDVGTISGERLLLHNHHGGASSVVKQVFGGSTVGDLANEEDLKGKSFQPFSAEDGKSEYSRTLDGIEDAHGKATVYGGLEDKTYSWIEYQYKDGCKLHIDRWGELKQSQADEYNGYVSDSWFKTTRVELHFSDGSGSEIVNHAIDTFPGRGDWAWNQNIDLVDIFTDDELEKIFEANGGSADPNSIPRNNTRISNMSGLSFSENNVFIFDVGGPVWTIQEGSDSENAMALIANGNPATNNFQVTGVDGKKDEMVVGSSGKAPFLQIDRSLYWTCIYDDFFESYLGSENGKYYWEDWQTIEKGIASGDNGWPTISNIQVDDDKGGKVEPDEAKRYGVAFNKGVDLLKDKKVGDGSIQSAYEEVMAQAAETIQQYVKNMRQDMQTIADSMPQQMQNCLAWADYQNSSDSEYQYQVDPSDANVTVNVTTNVSQTQYAQGDQKILNLKTLNDCGWEYSQNEGIYPTTEVGSANGVDTSRDARMVRGVEGSTWTSTQLPAEYTMSATVGRVTALAQTTGTNYPYSGIANGRLLSGTDRYALMQAHVIDYASIASGIAGDLALRQKINVVKVTNPEYSSITDFLDILGNLGGIFGEIGSTMLQTTAGWFSGMFWSSSDSSGLATSSDPMVTAAPAGVYQSGYNNGIVMNRVPASITKFDVDTGTVKQQALSNYTVASGSGSTLASAAGVTAIENIVAPMLLRQFSGLYQMLQSFGLIIVMICLTIIAFKNFMAYSTVRGGISSQEQNMYEAQMQLKQVLPRTIFAIFMIGLPPVGNSIGFEGGAYILLQLIGNVVSYVASIFTSLDGSGIMGLWTSMDVSAFGNDIFAYLGFFIMALIISVLFCLGVVAIFIQSLGLLAYYLAGPIIWAFYVWPKGGNMPGEGLVNRFPLSLVTQLGQSQTEDTSNRGAAKAWMIGYTTLAALTALWAIMFWIVSLMFVSTTGIGDSGAAAGTASELMLGATGYPQASAALLDDGIFLNSGVPEPVKYILLIIIALLLFGLMFKTTWGGMKAAWNTAAGAGMMMKNAVHKNVSRAKAIKNAPANAAARLRDKVDPNNPDRDADDTSKKAQTIIANAQQAVVNAGQTGSQAGKAAGLAKGRKPASNAPLAANAPAVTAATPAVAAPAAKAEKKEKEHKIANAVAGAKDAIGAAKDVKSLAKNKRKQEAAGEVTNALEKAKQSKDKDERKALLDGMSADAKNLANKLGVTKDGELAEGKALDAAADKADKYKKSLEKKAQALEGRMEGRDAKDRSELGNKVYNALGEKIKPDLEEMDRKEDLRQRALASGLKSGKTVNALDKAEDRNYNWQGTDYSERSAEEANNDLSAASKDVADGYLEAFSNERGMSAQEKLERTKALVEGRFGSIISDDQAAALQSMVDNGDAGMLTDAERNSLMAYNAMNNVAGALAPAAAAETVPGAAADPSFQQALDISRERNSLMDAAAGSNALMPAAVDALQAGMDPDSVSDAMSQFFNNSDNWRNMSDMLDSVSKADADPDKFGLSREEADKLVSNSQMFKDGSWIEATDGAGAGFREKALAELGTEGFEKALAAGDSYENALSGVESHVAAAALSGDSTLQRQAAVAMEHDAAGMSNAVFDGFAAAGEGTSYEEVRHGIEGQLRSQASAANAAYEQAQSDYADAAALNKAYRDAGAAFNAASEQYDAGSPEYEAAKSALYEAQQAYEAGPDVNTAAAAMEAAREAQQQARKDQAAGMAMLADGGEAIYNDMHKVAYGVGVDENFVGQQSFGVGAQVRTDFSSLVPPTESVVPMAAAGMATADMATAGMAVAGAEALNLGAGGPGIVNIQMNGYGDGASTFAMGGNAHVEGAGAVVAENAASGFGQADFSNANNAGFFSDAPSIAPSDDARAMAQAEVDAAFLDSAQVKADSMRDAGYNEADARYMASDYKANNILDNAERESRHMDMLSDERMGNLEQVSREAEHNIADALMEESEIRSDAIRQGANAAAAQSAQAFDRRALRMDQASSTVLEKEAASIEEGGSKIAEALRQSEEEAARNIASEGQRRQPRRTHKTGGGNAI